MMSKVSAYLDHIFRMVRPRRLLYMAIDGVAPRAKMNQQRSRRFRSALEAEKLKASRREASRSLGRSLRQQLHHAGTPFMARLSEHLKFYVLKKQTEDPLWQKATVILSGHEVRGEGEHKIMEHIRWGARTRMGPQPDALPVRTRRRPDHARARHARAALLFATRGCEVRRGRQLRAAEPRDASEPHGRRVPTAARRAAARVSGPGVPGDRRRVAFRVRLRTRRGRFRVALHARGERLPPPPADAGHRRGRSEHAVRGVPRAPALARLRLRRRRRRHVARRAWSASWR